MRRIAIIAVLSCVLAACGDSYDDGPTRTEIPSSAPSPAAPSATLASSTATLAAPTPTTAAMTSPAATVAPPAPTQAPPTALPTVRGDPTPTLLTIPVQIDGRSIIVEVADEPGERSQGLSDRDALPQDGGMLFVWDQPAEHTLWMKDMRIPLDFVWLDESKRVIKVEANVPHQPGASDAELVRYTSGPGALYAIELNAGAAARLGIGVGDVLAFDERP